MTLTADQVRATRFQATKFREGYDQLEVDAFLDRVADALDAVTAGAVPALSAEDVLDVKFQATKFREGYDQDQVDDFLDQVVAALGGTPGAMPAFAAPAPAEPVDAAQLRAATQALRPRRLRYGYDPDAVTAFLAEAAVELERRERGFRSSLSAQDVSQVHFAGTWWKPGLGQGEVDRLLDRVAAALRE